MPEYEIVFTAQGRVVIEANNEDEAEEIFQFMDISSDMIDDREIEFLEETEESLLERKLRKRGVEV